MSKNSLGRELPEQVGSYCVRPYEGAYQPLPEAKPVVTRRTAGHRVPGGNKLVPTLEDAILASGLKDGMTISFHHSSARCSPPSGRWASRACALPPAPW